MKHYTIQPPPRLAPFVRYFWVLECDLKAGSTYTYRSMADGCAELVFHYNAKFSQITGDGATNESFAAGLHAQSQRFRRFTVEKSFGVFGVCLYPFAIPRFFSLPASDLSNRLPDIENLLGSDGKELEEKMMLAANNFERAKIVSVSLEKRLDKNVKELSPITSAVRQIIDGGQAMNVEQTARDYSLSTRQFERKFKEFSGFGPKLFSRIARFHSAVSRYDETDKRQSLTGIGYDCGYYDQSHFINDFREFSGFSPKEYFSGQAEGFDWKKI